MPSGSFKVTGTKEAHRRCRVAVELAVNRASEPSLRENVSVWTEILREGACERAVTAAIAFPHR